MSLLMISETMQEREELLRTLSNEEKEFVVQFAFKTSDQELTDKLIGELAEARDGEEAQNIRKKYSAMYDVKPAWVNQIENLLVSIEMYRIEEQKAIGTFFKNLDNLTTIHQRKLEKLQNIKKAYLNEMFI